MKKNIIHNVDCLEFMKNCDGKVNLVLTSPPYNMTKRPGGDADSGRYDEYNDWKEQEEYLEWSADVFNSIDKILVEDGAILYNFSYSIENPSMPYQLVSYILENTNFCIADTIIWKKKSSMPYPASQNRLQRICEFVFVFVRKEELKTFDTNKKISKVSKTGQNYYTPIMNFIEASNNDESTKDINQATFSTDFCLKLLNIYSKPDKDFVVFDPFIGTGTTAKACVKYGCSYIGTEISKTQCKYAKERLTKIEQHIEWQFGGGWSNRTNRSLYKNPSGEN